MREITSDNHGGRPTGEDNLMGDSTGSSAEASSSQDAV
jgi:hypothetical protein